MSHTGPEHNSFDRCLDGLKRCSDDAAFEVWRRFAPKLRRRVDKRLVAHARLTLDADDVLQSAFHSFFHRFREDRFDLKNWLAIWQLLVTITDRKCNRQNRRSTAAKRTPACSVHTDETIRVCDAPAVLDGPATDAILAETLERLFESRDARDRDVLWMYLRRLPIPEIARAISLSQRSVQRSVRRASDWLEHQSQRS